MVGINVVAVFLGTLALAVWLAKRGAPPWWAGAYGLFPGIFIAIQYDLTEAVAYALVATAILLFDVGPEPRWLLAGVALGLAALGRETAAVFALGYFLTMIGSSNTPFRARLMRAAAFAGLSLAPVLCWKTLLWIWLGNIGTGAGLAYVPLGGILAYFPSARAIHLLQVLVVVVPGLMILAAVWLARHQGPLIPEKLNLIINTVLFVVLLDRSGYMNPTASLRISTAVCVATVAYLPLLRLGPRVAQVSAGSAIFLWMLFYPARMLHAVAPSFTG
jgi:hypothetical protein